MGSGQRYNARNILDAMYCHHLPGENAVIQVTDLGDSDKPIQNAGSHQTDGIHVGCEQDGWAAGLGDRRILPKGCAPMAYTIQTSQWTDADFVHQWLPRLADETPDGGFIA